MRIDRYVKRKSDHSTSVACLPVYHDGKRAVYCAQGWNAHLSPTTLDLEPGQLFDTHNDLGQVGEVTGLSSQQALVS